MKKTVKYLFILLLVSCAGPSGSGKMDVITVSIAPFRYFVEAIAGSDYDVNIMVPSSADPHVYEPVPGQVTQLSRSAAYVSNGYLGFEITWLDRFYESNPGMKKVSLANNITLIEAEEHHSPGTEGADPHYWSSPKSAYAMAATVRDLLCSLKPDSCKKYERNYSVLIDTIKSLDEKATRLFSGYRGRSFMIFHPALAYLARDYNLAEIAVENEGKEPSPSSMKRLIDEAKEKKIKIIFIQKGFDTKNAGAIAAETGAELVALDPLGDNWAAEESAILDAVHGSLVKSSI
ncbi:MAG TPA: zinc ABC transporter substrate-binding protein [Bacteroidales bacterium]|nr:zinc ABC transporter substrate-binding protein [Bacteroidales bacterium]